MEEDEKQESDATQEQLADRSNGKLLSETSRNGINIFYDMEDLSQLGFTLESNTVEVRDGIREKLQLVKKERVIIKLSEEEKLKRRLAKALKIAKAMGWDDAEIQEQLGLKPDDE